MMIETFPQDIIQGSLVKICSGSKCFKLTPDNGQYENVMTLPGIKQSIKGYTVKFPKGALGVVLFKFKDKKYWRDYIPARGGVWCNSYVVMVVPSIVVIADDLIIDDSWNP